LRFGGGEVLTKQSIDENLLKFNIPTEETHKIAEVDNFEFSSTQGCSQLKEKDKISPAKGELKTKRISLGKIILELDNLEDCIEESKPAGIKFDLDLYQMEKL
jgi:hypothetical protein